VHTGSRRIRRLSLRVLMSAATNRRVQHFFVSRPANMVHIQSH
jgi:hypothetical protein